MIEYVAGFLFDPNRISVALVRKNRPPWQAGKLNGIGGKKEPGEPWLEAMIREFEEETGVHIEDWEHTVTLTSSDPSWELRVFRAFSPRIRDVRSMESETITIESVIRRGHLGSVANRQTIPNLGWIVPLSLDDHIRFPVVLREKAKKP